MTVQLRFTPEKSTTSPIPVPPLKADDLQARLQYDGPVFALAVSTDTVMTDNKAFLAAKLWTLFFDFLKKNVATT